MRVEFETYMKVYKPLFPLDFNDLQNEYKSAGTQHMWCGWLAAKASTPQPVEGLGWGYGMIHKDYPNADRGFSWRADDPHFSADWKRIPLAVLDTNAKENTSFLTNRLRMWKQSGEPAPLNELQSIQMWLKHLGQHGAETTKKVMLARMALLTEAAAKLHKEGPKAEAAAGIYKEHPKLNPHYKPLDQDQDRIIRVAAESGGRIMHENGIGHELWCFNSLTDFVLAILDEAAKDDIPV